MNFNWYEEYTQIDIPIRDQLIECRGALKGIEGTLPTTPAVKDALTAVITEINSQLSQICKYFINDKLKR